MKTWLWGVLVAFLAALPFLVLLGTNFHWSSGNADRYVTFRTYQAEYDCCQREEPKCAPAMSAFKELVARKRREPTTGQKISQSLGALVGMDSLDLFVRQDPSREEIEREVARCRVIDLRIDPNLAPAD